MAFSGQAGMQRPQAWQASGWITKDCLPPWAQTLRRTRQERFFRSSSVRERISKTSYGQTSTQGPLFSQRWESTTGIKRPGSASQFDSEGGFRVMTKFSRAGSAF